MSEVRYMVTKKKWPFTRVCKSSGAAISAAIRDFTKTSKSGPKREVWERMKRQGFVLEEVHTLTDADYRAFAKTSESKP